MSIGKTTLLKKAWRSDAIWTLPRLYATFFVRIPHYFDTRALLQSQYWPREKLEELSQERVHHIVRTAAKIPYWKEIFRKRGIDADAFHIDDLAKLPVSTKRDFQTRTESDYTIQELISRSHKDFTSGSTGKPFDYYFGYTSELRCFAFCERMFIALCDTRYPVVSVRARSRIGFIFKNHTMFFMRGFSSAKHRIDDLIVLGKKFKRGFMLYGYTSWLLEIGRELEEKGAILPVRAVIATGEGISPEGRASIERMFKAKFHLSYATRELGWLGFECPEKNMHLNEEWARVEIVDENGIPLPFGSEGRIVVTTFDNDVMPFLRYDIGDRGVISSTQCDCGRTLRTITFLGRHVEYIKVGPGRTISLLDISSAFDHFATTVTHYQIIQTGEVSFIMKVVRGSDFDINHRHLHDLLVRIIHPAARIDWEFVEDIPPAPSGKAAYFVRAD